MLTQNKPGRLDRPVAIDSVYFHESAQCLGFLLRLARPVGLAAAASCSPREDLRPEIDVPALRHRVESQRGSEA
eukprot:5421251-Heterocapsa_arctica.AAC.1